tara:strand:+ start:72 stop:269 length:198 start_codon:yes stop_codon:yes gene_type:complete
MKHETLASFLDTVLEVSGETWENLGPVWVPVEDSAVRRSLGEHYLVAASFGEKKLVLLFGEYFRA